LVAVCVVGRAGNEKGPGRYALRAKLEIRPSRLEEPGGDPRLLRLTMDGLLDRTCRERPRASRIGSVPRLDLPED
jgi:hypothetical protein